MRPWDGSIGLVLFLGVFLPTAKGCNNKVVYPVQAVQFRKTLRLEDLLASYLVLWPYCFGLAVALTTWWMLRRSDLRRARSMWWTFTALVAINLALLGALAAFRWLPDMLGDGGGDVDDSPILRGYLIFTGLSLLATLMSLRARNWFRSAMWMQAVLALLAAITLALFLPLVVFAGELLFGWKLAFTAAILLSIAALIQQFDGERVLGEGGEHASPVQFTLRQIIILMVVGGVASAIVIQCWTDADAWLARYKASLAEPAAATDKTQT